MFLFFIVLILCTIARVLLRLDLSTAATSFAILHTPISLMVHAFFALRSLLALSFVSIFRPRLRFLTRTSLALAWG